MEKYYARRGSDHKRPRFDPFDGAQDGQARTPVGETFRSPASALPQVVLPTRPVWPGHVSVRTSREGAMPSWAGSIDPRVSGSEDPDLRSATCRGAVVTTSRTAAIMGGPFPNGAWRLPDRMSEKIGI